MPRQPIIYADSYGVDPEFYSFVQTLESLHRVIGREKYVDPIDRFGIFKISKKIPRIANVEFIIAILVTLVIPCAIKKAPD